ncbi:glycosyltransferase [Deinococcus radiophilus]|nr:glycosyltransferase [Deinococcus radiophilus]UFA51504.1 glycosyltransferase [Deinococcus radiophilus]
MKILHLTTAHADDDVRIYVKEAASLAQHYDTALIAPRRSERVYGDITYLPLTPAHSRAERLLLQREALRLVEQFGPDVVHLHDPELLFLGLYLRARGVKVVWDVHEDLPRQVLHKPWIPARLRGATSVAAKGFEAVAGLAFDQIVPVTDSIAEAFPAHKVVKVQNFPILGELGEPKQTNPEAPIRTFVHAGGLTSVRGIFEITEAIGQLNEQLGKDARLLLIGKFESSAFEEKCRESAGWSYVDYHPWVDRKKLAALLAGADAGVVTFLPVPNHTSSQPNKLFEYMSLGLPLIASNFDLWKELIEIKGSGVLVDPERPQEIAQAMAWMVDHPAEARAMGMKGRHAVETEFNWDAEFTKLLDMYRRLETL